MLLILKDKDSPMHFFVVGTDCLSEKFMIPVAWCGMFAKHAANAVKQ